MAGREDFHDGSFDRKRTSGAEDFSDGAKRRSRDVRYHDESQQRRSLNRNVNNADLRQGGTPVTSRRTPNEWRGSYHRRSGYGTDPELEELYHSVENQTEHKQPRSHHSSPRNSGYVTDPERRTPQSISRNKNSKHHGSNNQVNNPYSGYGTDSEIMAYNGPFDYSEPDDDHRRNRSPQRSLERRTHSPKKRDYHQGNSVPAENVDDGSGDNDELEWAYPEFESNAGKGDSIGQERMSKRQLTEEPRSGRHHPSDHPVALNRIAMANACLERDGHLKEAEKGDLSSETESQQGLHWDISEILGSSSHTTGKNGTDTPGRSPQIYKPGSKEHNVDHDGKRAETEINKNLIASTPDVGRQGDSEATVKDKQVPELARRIESEMDTVTDQVNRLELTPGGGANKSERPLPPYAKKRDPKSPLPPSPMKQHHSDSPAPAFAHRPLANPSPLPQHHQVRHRTDSPLPPYRGRPTPKGHTPDSHTQGGHLHIVNRQTPSDNRTPNDSRPVVGQTPKRSAIPSYEEALSRRRDSLGYQKSQSATSTPHEPRPKTENRRPEASVDNLQEGENKQKHFTTHSGHLNERPNDRKERHSDDYDYPDMWPTDPQTTDTELHGQPHDRKTEYNRPGGETPLKYRRDKKVPPSEQDQPDSNANIYNSKPLQSHQDYVDLHRNSPSEVPPNRGSGRYDRGKYRHSVEDNLGRHEADVNRNIPRGTSPTPVYPASKDRQPPPYRKGVHPANRDGRQERPLDNQERDGKYNGQQESAYHRQRDTNHNIQEDTAYTRDARYNGQRTPVPHQEVTPGSRIPPRVNEDHGSRRGSGDGNMPPVINDDNWRQHVLNKVVRKTQGARDDYQVLSFCFFKHCHMQISCVLGVPK